MSSLDFPSYGERLVVFEGLHRFDAWTVKLYTIDAHGSVRPSDVVRAALARIPDLLPAGVAGGRAAPAVVAGAPEGAAGSLVHGEAFAIVHAGADAVWLLVHWWTDTCLMHHRMVAASLDDPTAFDIGVPSTLIACSWELAVVQHEREAWVRTVQGRGAAADFVAYRADVMPAGSI